MVLTAHFSIGVEGFLAFYKERCKEINQGYGLEGDSERIKDLTPLVELVQDAKSRGKRWYSNCPNPLPDGGCSCLDTREAKLQALKHAKDLR